MRAQLTLLLLCAAANALPRSRCTHGCVSKPTTQHCFTRTGQPCPSQPVEQDHGKVCFNGISLAEFKLWGVLTRCPCEAPGAIPLSEHQLNAFVQDLHTTLQTYYSGPSPRAAFEQRGQAPEDYSTLQQAAFRDGPYPDNGIDATWNDESQGVQAHSTPQNPVIWDAPEEPTYSPNRIPSDFLVKDFQKNDRLQQFVPNGQAETPHTIERLESALPGHLPEIDSRWLGRSSNAPQDPQPRTLYDASQALQIPQDVDWEQPKRAQGTAHGRFERESPRYYQDEWQDSGEVQSFDKQGHGGAENLQYAGETRGPSLEVKETKTPFAKNAENPKETFESVYKPEGSFHSNDEIMDYSGVPAETDPLQNTGKTRGPLTSVQKGKLSSKNAEETNPLQTTTVAQDPFKGAEGIQILPNMEKAKAPRVSIEEDGISASAEKPNPLHTTTDQNAHKGVDERNVWPNAEKATAPQASVEEDGISSNAEKIIPLRIGKEAKNSLQSTEETENSATSRRADGERNEAKGFNNQRVKSKESPETPIEPKEPVATPMNNDETDASNKQSWKEHDNSRSEYQGPNDYPPYSRPSYPRYPQSPNYPSSYSPHPPITNIVPVNNYYNNIAPIYKFNSVTNKQTQPPSWPPILPPGSSTTNPDNLGFVDNRSGMDSTDNRGSNGGTYVGSNGGDFLDKGASSIGTDNRGHKGKYSDSRGAYSTDYSSSNSRGQHTTTGSGGSRGRIGGDSISEMAKEEPGNGFEEEMDPAADDDYGAQGDELDSSESFSEPNFLREARKMGNEESGSRTSMPAPQKTSG
ncbi:hypothetical protein CDD81_191 [Ophiocordyceps australis]|uniref:Extracellular membrane protein CFEM domain-containing protein n=1 Tax=Ophiocordyceps australis TaxID=1399860 RepID=A0A2C5XL35_9HYPO|nr:hypothetical protein CDD81_191 [Ophiocordyceps australis]